MRGDWCFTDQDLQHINSQNKEGKIPQNNHFSYKLVSAGSPYKIGSCWHNHTILEAIAYISMDLNVKVLADKILACTDLGFFSMLVSPVYSCVNILLGLKTQHDLQYINICLDCPMTMLKFLFLLFAFTPPASCRQVQGGKKKSLSCAFSFHFHHSLIWRGPATSKAMTENAREPHCNRYFQLSD